MKATSSKWRMIACVLPSVLVGIVLIAIISVPTSVWFLIFGDTETAKQAITYGFYENPRLEYDEFVWSWSRLG